MKQNDTNADMLCLAKRGAIFARCMTCHSHTDGSTTTETGAQTACGYLKTLNVVLHQHCRHGFFCPKQVRKKLNPAASESSVIQSPVKSVQQRSSVMKSESVVVTETLLPNLGSPVVAEESESIFLSFGNKDDFKEQHTVATKIPPLMPSETQLQEKTQLDLVETTHPVLETVIDTKSSEMVTSDGKVPVTTVVEPQAQVTITEPASSMTEVIQTPKQDQNNDEILESVTVTMPSIATSGHQNGDSGFYSKDQPSSKESVIMRLSNR